MVEGVGGEGGWEGVGLVGRLFEGLGLGRSIIEELRQLAWGWTYTPNVREEARRVSLGI